MEIVDATVHEDSKSWNEPDMKKFLKNVKSFKLQYECRSWKENLNRWNWMKEWLWKHEIVTNCIESAYV